MMQYMAPSTMDEALSVLRSHATSAVLLAGGQVLVPELRSGRIEPNILIDLGRIPQLRTIEERDDRYWIGAGVTHSNLLRNVRVCRDLPVLAQAASRIGDLQVRNRATVGGTIAVGESQTDYWSVFYATDATVVLCSPTKERELPLRQFLLARGKTVRQEDEIIKGIWMKKAPTSRSQKFIISPSDFLCGAFVEMSERSAVLAITGLQELPQRFEFTDVTVDRIQAWQDWIGQQRNADAYVRQMIRLIGEQLIEGRERYA